MKLPPLRLPDARQLARHVALGLLVALAWICLLRGLRVYQEVMNTRAYDLLSDWGGAKALAAGISPYSDQALAMLGFNHAHGQGHPPTVFPWFLQLADLQLPAAKLAWNEVTLVLLLLHLLIVARELKAPAPLVLAPLLLGVVLATSWMRYHMAVSQLSEMIAFLYLVAWCLLRRGEDFRAGVVLGLACTFKFYPGTVVLLLLLSGRFRAVAGAALGWLVIALPITVRLGRSAWSDFFEQVRPYTVFWMTHAKNLSIQGLVQRVHFPLCEFPAAHREPWRPGTYIASAIVLALVAGLALLSRRAMADRRTIDLPFAAFTALSMISGPYTWDHYDVTLILPLSITAAALYRLVVTGRALPLADGGVLVLGLIVWLLDVDIDRKNRLWDAWYTPNKPTHFNLHLHEATSWLPTPLLLLLLAGLLFYTLRHRLLIAPAVAAPAIDNGSREQ